MKDLLTIPVQVQDLDEKDLVAAAEHRKKYSLLRDIQAEAFNRAIVTRLEKEKEKEQMQSVQGEAIIQIICEKCGKELSADQAKNDLIHCPECSQDTRTE
jgi:uncharacterized membrane protein YqiK